MADLGEDRVNVETKVGVGLRQQYKECPVTSYVNENQRWWIGAGWTKSVAGRERWSDDIGKARTFEQENKKLPEGWEWMSDWKINCDKSTHKDGWMFSSSFKVGFKGAWGNKELGRTVRRRRWERTRRTQPIEQTKGGEEKKEEKEDKEDKEEKEEKEDGDGGGGEDKAEHAQGITLTPLTPSGEEKTTNNPNNPGNEETTHTQEQEQEQEEQEEQKEQEEQGERGAVSEVEEKDRENTDMETAATGAGNADDSEEKSKSTSREDKKEEKKEEKKKNGRKLRIGVFFNAKAGGGMGIKLYKRYMKQTTSVYAVHPYNLSNGGPGPGLRELLWGDSKATIDTADPAVRGCQVRVLAAGGDGTGAWVLSIIDKLIKEVKESESKHKATFEPPAMGMVPLGTGNDLARVTNFGGSFEDEYNIYTLCKLIDEAELVKLDRWMLTCTPSAEGIERELGVERKKIQDAGRKRSTSNYKGKNKGEVDAMLKRRMEKHMEKDEKKKKILMKTKQVVMNNYMGLGVVADTALAFHQKRESNPNRSQSQAGNIIIYGVLGGKRTLTRPYANIHTMLDVKLDQKAMDFKTHGLADIEIVNIPSFSGGCDLWGKRASKHPQAMDDKKFEVVGIESSFHVGEVRIGLGSGIRLGQASHAQITTTCTLPIQVDGEAWMQPPSVVDVTHFCQSTLLKAKAKKKR